MLELLYGDTVTSQQRTWFNEALSRMAGFLKDAHTVAFKASVHTVDEPPCPGHNDYMCTTVSAFPQGHPRDAEVDFYIRTAADDPEQSFNAGVSDDVKKFFMESAVHEYFHAITFMFLATNDVEKERLCGWFRYEKTGQAGKLENWNPIDQPWENRIQEAVAEFLKDVYMPDSYRYYENRTKWWFDKGYFIALLDLIESFMCPPDYSPT